jgi:hypothetical protein
MIYLVLPQPMANAGAVLRDKEFETAPSSQV